MILDTENTTYRPVFAELITKGKPRRVRHFGECVVISKDGSRRVIRPEGYMFIKDEPFFSGKDKTRYTYGVHN